MYLHGSVGTLPDIHERQKSIEKNIDPNLALEASLGAGLVNPHPLPSIKRKKKKLKLKHQFENEDRGYYSNIDPNIEAMKIVQERSNDNSMIKNGLALAKLKDPNFVRNHHKLDGTYSSKTPNAFAGYGTRNDTDMDGGYGATPGVGYGTTPSMGYGNGSNGILPQHMYKSNQQIPTLNNSMQMNSGTKGPSGNQSQMTNRNKYPQPLSTMKKKFDDPFMPRSFATLDPYKDGVPRKPKYNPASLNRSSQPSFIKNSPGHAYFPAEEIPKLTGKPSKLDVMSGYTPDRNPITPTVLPKPDRNHITPTVLPRLDESALMRQRKQDEGTR